MKNLSFGTALALRLAVIAVGGLIGFFAVGHEQAAGSSSATSSALLKKNAAAGSHADGSGGPSTVVTSVPSLPEPDRALGNGGGIRPKAERIGQQIMAGEAATGSTLWLPKQAAQSLKWDLGNVGVTCSLTSTTQKALQLSKPVKSALEREVDTFLQTVRSTELKNVELLENTGDSVWLHIPAGLNVTDALSRLQANVRSMIGEDKAAILLPKLEQEFQSITPLIRGEERFMNVKLVGDTGVEVATSDKMANDVSWHNYIPSTLRHLVQVGEDNLRKK